MHTRQKFFLVSFQILLLLFTSLLLTNNLNLEFFNIYIEGISFGEYENIVLIVLFLLLSLTLIPRRRKSSSINYPRKSIVRERINEILKKLCVGLYEKEEEVKLALLASIAGEGIFLLGPPGVAKSLIARKIKHCFEQEKSFEYLMTRFSTPDEVFGPISIKALKDKGQYIRIVKNYLPGANIVFLDEIWKAGPPIQNALLTVLNEKIYRNGDEEIKLSLYSLISASNELPAKGEGLEALWDRFLVRLLVKGIQKRELFDQMLTDKSNPYVDHIPKYLKILDAEYQDWTKKISEIEVPNRILEIIDITRKKIELRNNNFEEPEEKIYVSDRRWKKIMRLLKACAFLNGRKTISLSDFFIVYFCIWDKENQLEDVNKIVRVVVEDHGYQINKNIKILQEELSTLETDIQEKKNLDIKISLRKSWDQKVLEIEKNRSDLLNKIKGELLSLEKNLFVPDEFKNIVIYDLKKSVEVIEYQLDENLKKIKSFYDEKTNS